MNYNIIDKEMEKEVLDDEGPPHLSHELIDVTFEGFQSDIDNFKRKQNHRWDHIENVDQVIYSKNIHFVILFLVFYYDL